MAMKYKFMIAFENSRTNGYMTEKFFNAMYGYTIPIHFGDAMAAKYFNDGRFINCNISNEHGDILDNMVKEYVNKGIEMNETMLLPQVRNVVGDRLNECIDRVVEIDDDDKKYKEMLLQPLFKNNKYDKSILNPFVMAERLKVVLRN